MGTIIDSGLEARARTVASALSEQGWCCYPVFFEQPTIFALSRDLLQYRAAFTAAAIGRGAARQLLPQQRGDFTHWLDGDSAVQRDLLRTMADLRGLLNRQLLLGLGDFEAHYAHYAPGSFYRRHLDTFSAGAGTRAPRRIVSAVFYLNDCLAAGGELCLWRGQQSDRGAGELARISPRAGTAVFFLSAEFPHEVLPTRVDRYSIAGWFRAGGVL